jgi:hypothetical protein
MMCRSAGFEHMRGEEVAPIPAPKYTHYAACIYSSADLTMMENAIGKSKPAGSIPAGFKAYDNLLAFLATL